MGIKYNGAICSFGEIVLADITHITVNKLALRNNEQRVEGIWLGKTTNSGEHVIATNDNDGTIFHTRTEFDKDDDRSTMEQDLFENIKIPQMDTTMYKNYTQEEDIGKPIIDQYFTKTGLTQKQSGQTLDQQQGGTTTT
eukprot:5759742-Amphidinium_carterae.1